MTYVQPKHRKLQKPKAYLVIGCAHLGIDEQLLRTLANYAKAYDASVVHLGSICTDLEKTMHASRTKKVRTFEKGFEEKVDSLDKAAAKYDRLGKVAEYNNTVGVWQRLEKRAEAEIEQMEKEIADLLAAEKLRVTKLKSYFPGIKFVANKEQFILESHFGGSLIGPELKLSKHISLQSVMANGTKTTSQPITERAFSYLKTMKTSVIVPHPTPALRSFNREGLNKAWEIYTTGSLFYSDAANRPSEYFKAVHMPAGMLLLMDEVNDEFHPRRVHFDRVSCKVSKKPVPAILDDGRVFTGSSSWEVKGDDLAVFTTDGHGPFEHRGVVGAARSACLLTKAETFVDGGDLNDWIFACPHNIGSPLYAEGLRAIDDEAAFKRLAAALTDSPYIKRKVLIDSNHHAWLTRLVAKHPWLKGLLDLESVYKRTIPEWEAYIVKPGEDYTFTWGDLAARHGHDTGPLSSALKVWDKFICGHFHNHEELLRAVKQGAMAGLGPAYIENNLTSWTNNISIWTRCQGKTAVNAKIVLHDDKKKVSRYAYRDQIIEVEWHKYPEEK